MTGTIKNPVMELMVTLSWGNQRIRVWWTDDGQSHGEIYKGIMLKLSLEDNASITTKQRALLIADYSDSVAAVEVLGPDGDGVVFYPDWK